MSLVLAGILGYVVVQLLIGMLVSRHIATEEDYLLAGRSFGFGLATFSFFATWFGAETCISASGRIYERGLSGGSADPFGYGGCLLLMGLVFAAPLWRRKLTTLADLFRIRYSAGVERFAVLMMVPTSVFWAAAQVRAFGHVLGASSELNVTAAITIAAGVAIAYTAAGGMRADVLTDLIQGIMIIVGLVVLLLAVFGSGDLNGWKNIDAARLNPFGGDLPWTQKLEAWAIPIFGSVVAQELVARVLSSRSPEVARGGALCGATLYLLVGFIPAVLGLIGPVLLANLSDPEQFLPQLAQKHLGPFLYVLFAGALVSAILSTVDSTLLAAASLTAHNVVIPLKKDLSQRAKVGISRAGVVVFGIVAWCLALSADTIYSLVETASSFGSAGLFAILVFGLFTRLGGRWSAYTALLLGIAIWVTGTLSGWTVVYVWSLAGALIGYVAVAWLEGALTSARAAPTDVSNYSE